MKREKKRSLKRLMQVRFVLLATLAAALLLCLIDGIVLWRSQSLILNRADHILEIIKNDSESAELADNHYFAVYLSSGERTVSADLSHTAFMQEKVAFRMAREVLKTEKDQGFLNTYRYSVIRNGRNITVLFLSQRLPLETFLETRKLLIAVSLFGLAGAVMILAVFSGRIVAPLAEAHEKQKAFITSASHAMKTPLAVILGDVQLLQMDAEENEWLNDIENQAHHLSEMTQSLVTLSRYDEGPGTGNFILFPISDVAQETADSFKSIAAGKNIRYDLGIAPGLSYSGDERALTEMLKILLDNAFRYCPENGNVSFALRKKHLRLEISVRNTAENIHKEELPRFTERFYRGSTSGSVPGSGLGLAIAQSTARQHHGKLTVTAPNAHEISVSVMI